MLELAALSRVFAGCVVIDRLDFKIEHGDSVGILPLIQRLNDPFLFWRPTQRE